MQHSHPTVVVADNHGGVRETVATVLAMEGYRVLQAADGAEVLEIIAVEAPDLLLLDLSMPRIDGWEVMELLRPQLPRFPVIIMSASLHAPSISVELGADGCLVKPFQLPDLLRVVAERTAPLAAA